MACAKGGLKWRVRERGADSGLKPARGGKSSGNVEKETGSRRDAHLFLKKGAV